MNEDELLSHLRSLAQAVSEQGGEVQAYGAALRGLLRAFSQSQEVRGLVAEELERDAANILGASLNAWQAEAFDRARDLLLASLQEQPKS